MPAAFEDTLPGPDIESVRRSAARSRRLLAVTVLVVTTLIWGTWLEITTHEKRQALQAAARRQGNMAVAVGQYLARALANADAVAQFLAGVHATPGADFRAHLVARARANDLFSEVAACFADGAYVTSRPGAGDLDVATRCAAWLREAAPGARTRPGQTVQVSGRPLVPLLTALPSAAGRPAGVIALLVDVGQLLGLLQDYRIPDETVVLLAGPDGQPRARWHSERSVADQRAPEAALLPAVLAAGTLGQVHRLGGRSVLASARALDGSPFTVLVATSEPDTLAEPLRRSAWYAAACAAATLLISGFALVLLRAQLRARSMAESLARARERLHAANVDLEAQVRARTGELEAACRDLESFSYTVAHDVRAPVTAIQGFADALAPRLAASGDEKSTHYLRRIVANASRMSEITEALLVLGRLSRSPVAFQRVDLGEIAHEVLAGLREREPQPRTVETHVQPGLQVQGDRVLLRQVLENLLGNAWKFSARRSPARISVEASADAEGWLTVAVRDNGEGFDMAHAPHLFQPFRRAHGADDFAGTGVGLAAVERIVRLHGGRAWIVSSPAQGTTVSFTLRAFA